MNTLEQQLIDVIQPYLVSKTPDEEIRNAVHRLIAVVELTLYVAQHDEDEDPPLGYNIVVEPIFDCE